MTCLTLFKVSQTNYQRVKLTHTSRCDCLTQHGLYLYIYTLLSPQDLKPSNLAVNEDCELKVRKRHCSRRMAYLYVTSTHSLVVTLLYIDSMNTAVCHTDPGFWFGKAHRWWNDRLCRHTVVPSSRNHAELDALQHDRYLHKIAELRYFCPCIFYIYKCNVFT